MGGGGVGGGGGGGRWLAAGTLDTGYKHVCIQLLLYDETPFPFPLVKNVVKISAGACGEALGGRG